MQHLSRFALPLFLVALGLICGCSENNNEAKSVSALEATSTYESYDSKPRTLGEIRLGLHKILSSKFGYTFCDIGNFSRVPVSVALNEINQAFSGYEVKGEVYDQVMDYLENNPDAVVFIGKVQSTPEVQDGLSTTSNVIIHVSVPRNLSYGILEDGDSGFTLDLTEIAMNSELSDRCFFARCCEGQRGKDTCCSCWCVQTSCGSCNYGTPTCPWVESCGCENTVKSCSSIPTELWLDDRPVDSIEYRETL